MEKNIYILILPLIICSCAHKKDVRLSYFDHRDDIGIVLKTKKEQPLAFDIRVYPYIGQFVRDDYKKIMETDPDYVGHTFCLSKNVYDSCGNLVYKNAVPCDLLITDCYEYYGNTEAYNYEFLFHSYSDDELLVRPCLIQYFDFTELSVSSGYIEYNFVFLHNQTGLFRDVSKIQTLTYIPVYNNQLFFEIKDSKVYFNENKNADYAYYS